MSTRDKIIGIIRDQIASGELARYGVLVYLDARPRTTSLDDALVHVEVDLDDDDDAGREGMCQRCGGSTIGPADALCGACTPWTRPPARPYITDVDAIGAMRERLLRERGQ